MHVVIMGCGRVGSSLARALEDRNHTVSVIDTNPDSFRRLGPAFNGTKVTGFGFDQAVLSTAGIERAGALVAALADDAANLFVSLSGRTLNPDLFIVARARQEDSIDKLARAGADRVVNPQSLGAARMASFVVRPHVAEFVDVVMHERSMEFRMQEVVVPANSCFAGRTLRELDLRQRAGVLVLAVRDSSGAFRSNPDPDTVIAPGDVVIAVGTETGLQRLCELADDR